jgi:hypothetical protein
MRFLTATCNDTCLRGPTLGVSTRRQTLWLVYMHAESLHRSACLAVTDISVCLTIVNLTLRTTSAAASLAANALLRVLNMCNTHHECNAAAACNDRRRGNDCARPAVVPANLVSSLEAVCERLPIG